MPTEHIRNSRGEGDKLRRVIIDAAITLVDIGSPLETLSLRAIARQGGISAPSIYAHFPNLEAVRRAVIDDSFIELRNEIVASWSPALNAESVLVRTCTAYFEFGRHHIERYRAMFSPEGYGPQSGAALELLEEQLSACVMDGVSHSTDVHGDAFLLWAAMHGMTALPRPMRSEDWRLGPVDRVELFERMVLRIAQINH